MKILIAPNAFKGTLSALEAGEIIASELKIKYSKSEIEIHPIADGGDGTCELLGYSLNLSSRKIWSLDATGKPIIGTYYFEGAKAYIDVSNVSGLGHLDPNQLEIRVSSTYGTGLLIKHAIENGASEIILGLGGSATIDLGVGILQALGLFFLDENGRELIPFSYDLLFKVRHIQKSPKFPKVSFICVCDVRNTFKGTEGAIPVFGPQKGLKSEEIPSYEAQCDFLLNLLFKKNNLPFIDKIGFGAAGGISAGLSGFFNTKIEIGSSYFFKKTGLEKKLVSSDLIITGEGRYDNQSKSGKACFEILQLAKKNDKKIFLITSGEELTEHEFDQVLYLPALDFSVKGFKEKARKNLQQIAGCI
ncbi:glycerate kinase [Algoriphagus sp.]|uniref:glycerate kinase family protein n=1 Tax=Algoriphagus sp. TaxID=1872435 RepID=UPI0025E9171E|nr:glycerate kinase [Algoriphagus sp.]